MVAIKLHDSPVEQSLSNNRHTYEYPDIMTESELIQFLRIPEVSNSKDHSNVVKNLIRMRDLPRIQICKRLLFPKKAILEWIEKETTNF